MFDMLRLQITCVVLLTCIVSILQASMITYTHKLMGGPRDQIPAMLRVKDLVSAISFTGQGTAPSRGQTTEPRQTGGLGSG